jgi:hypothetical protein
MPCSKLHAVLFAYCDHCVFSLAFLVDTITSLRIVPRIICRCIQ